MSSWIKTSAVLFALPLVAFFFFNYASQLQTNNLKSAYERAIIADKTLSDAEKSEQRELVRAFDFEKACAAPVNNMGLERECKEYGYFAWAKIAALILLGMGLSHILLIAAFVTMAKQSKKNLLLAFPIAWGSSTLMSVLILVGQGALAAVTFYYATTLLLQVYFPKLLIFMLAAVGYALYRIVRALLSNAESALHEPTSEAVTEEAAPLLWQRVKEIAQKLDTTPPDSILVGMNTSFYVTEFPIVHSAGFVTGRTLYLSAPMMQVMSSDDVSAIIGHEMGHFKGEDTVMTRELSPRITKSENTLTHLREAGIVGMPALYAMLAFRNLFEKTISTFKRERELAADTYGVSVTNREVSALALVRYCYQSEAYDAAMREHMIHGTNMDEVLPRFQDEFRVNDAFWKALATHGLPHPFDTHPPMTLRLEKFGYTVENLRFKACEKVERSAFDAFMGSFAAIANAMAEQKQMVEHIQEQAAVSMAGENELSSDVIAKHFPRLEIKAKKSKVVKNAIEHLFLAILPAFFLGVGTVALASSMGNSNVTVIGFACAGAVLLLCLAIWWREVQRWKTDVMVLNHHGIGLSSWKEQARFADIHSMKITVESKPFFNKYYLMIEFEEKRDSIWKQTYIRRKRKEVGINLSIFEGTPEEISDTVLRYFTRGLLA